MKYLIISDVHQKLKKVDIIIKNNKFDRLISLGDWFDNFGDTAKDAEQTAEYILKLFHEYKQNFIWILGNHDVPYVFPGSFDYTRCSGVTEAKLKLVTKTFARNLDTSKLKLAYRIKFKNKKDIILSHAGVSKYHFGLNVSGKKAIEMCDEALNALHALEKMPSIGGVPDMLQAGRARGGRHIRGGINWQDWNMEFSPIPVMSQIVGHTPLHNPCIIDAEGKGIAPNGGTLETGFYYNIAPEISYNINMDTHLNHYLVIENAKITIHEYASIN